MPQPNADTTDTPADDLDPDLAAQAAADEGADDDGEGQGEGEAAAGAEGAAEGAAADTEGGATDAAAADGEVVITLDGAELAEGEDGKTTPKWLPDLRRANREKERRIRELEAQLAKSAPAAPALGAKPTLESCDFDTERFQSEYEAWTQRKVEQDQAERQRQQDEQAERAQWQTRLDAVTRAASTLRVQDYDDAAEAFSDAFNPVQQAIIVAGPDDPKAAALLRYVLGKNPGKAAELAAIKDPVKFAFAVSKLETQVKVTTRKLPPAPDRVVRASGAGTAAVDSALAKLEADAEKTGDRTKVAAYLRQKRQAQTA